MNAYLPGFFASLALIIAIGAQNAFVIRQGLTRSHVFQVVAICAASDAILIFLGAAGVGHFIQTRPTFLEIARWFGVAYLIWFAIKSFRSAFKHQTLEVGEIKSASLRKVVASVLGFTFLNPHVYLDTMIFLGTLAGQFKSERWYFALGASTASILWFTTIGYGAKSMSRYMSKAIFWKILDLLIATVMVSIAIYLAIFHF